MKIGIIGASGYTGAELIRGLSYYREVEINQIVSRSFAGKKLKDVFPHLSYSRYQDLTFEEEADLDSSDFYFLALPHQPSVELVKSLHGKGKKIIDLSAAYRIKNPDAYLEYYGFEHKYSDLLYQSVYGLPEIFREEIENASVVANPGCYPTATLLAIFPAVKEGVVQSDSITVNALSGISGAGRSLKQQFHYPEAYGDVYAYKPIKHRHIPEIENVINTISERKLTVRFTPHIIPVSRGMVATITFKTSMNKKQLEELYRLEYRYEPFIRIVNQPPHIKNVVGSNFCDIYIDYDKRTGDAVIISAIDNIGKGASLQALQNFNIMNKIPEDKYLMEISHISILFP